MGSSRSLENFIGYLPRFTRVRVARGERGRQKLNERRRKFLRCNKGCAILFSDQLRGRDCEAVGLRVHYGESDAEKTWRGSAGSPHIAHSNGSIWSFSSCEAMWQKDKGKRTCLNNEMRKISHPERPSWPSRENGHTWAVRSRVRNEPAAVML